MLKQWKLRLNAYAILPPILRTLSALIPIAMLGVSRIIIDALTALSQNKPTQFTGHFGHRIASWLIYALVA